MSEKYDEKIERIKRKRAGLPDALKNIPVRYVEDVYDLSYEAKTILIEALAKGPIVISRALEYFQQTFSLNVDELLNAAKPKRPGPQAKEDLQDIENEEEAVIPQNSSTPNMLSGPSAETPYSTHGYETTVPMPLQDNSTTDLSQKTLAVIAEDTQSAGIKTELPPVDHRATNSSQVMQSTKVSLDHQDIQVIISILTTCYPSMPRQSASALAESEVMREAVSVVTAVRLAVESNNAKSDFVILSLFGLISATKKKLSEIIQSNPAFLKAIENSGIALE